MGTKPTLYILSGRPFSGKTKLTQILIEELGLTLVSYDQIWIAKNNELDRWLSWDEVTKIAHKDISRLLSSGSSVVYDSLGDTVWYRQQLIDLAESLGATSCILFIDTPEKIRRERFLYSKSAQDRYTPTTKEFNATEKEFEPPRRDENPITIRTADTTESIINQIRTYEG